MEVSASAAAVCRFQIYTRGIFVMSDMLLDLKNCCCSIKNDEEEYLTGSADIVCEVLDVDDEWIKIFYTDKTGQRIVKIERTDSILSVKIFRS
jgi:hypothetical protein